MSSAWYIITMTYQIELYHVVKHTEKDTLFWSTADSPYLRFHPWFQLTHGQLSPKNMKWKIPEITIHIF